MMTRGRRQVIFSVVVVAMVLALVVAAIFVVRSNRPAEVDTSQAPAPTLRDAGRGTVLGSEVLPSLAPQLAVKGVNAIEVLYASTSGIVDGPVGVSGSIFVPPGQPPEGGWDIVSFGHGTSGVTDNCAPSRDSSLYGSVGLVSALVDAGYVVAMTDYQGLGTPGPHPYLEPRSAAYSMIDIVRAATALVPQTSGRWIAVGDSQGGQASWAANQYAGVYGEGLTFLGSVNLEPAADISGMLDLAIEDKLSTGQQLVYGSILIGLQAVHPELEITDYLRGPMGEEPLTWLACTGDGIDAKVALMERLRPGDTVPRSVEAADKLRNWLQGTVIEPYRASAPMLVMYGDADTLILPEWQERAITAACDRGDTIERVVRPGEGHGRLESFPQTLQWVKDRFAARPTLDQC